MISISLCMIVRDEEKVLGRCLDSVRELADEIIIVDTGSRDRTKEIAGKYTDKIYDFRWEDDFSAAEILLLPEHPEHIACDGRGRCDAGKQQEAFHGIKSIPYI